MDLVGWTWLGGLGWVDLVGWTWLGGLGRVDLVGWTWSGGLGGWTCDFFKGHFELDFRKQLSRFRIRNMTTIDQIQNINNFMKGFLETHGVDDEIFNEWKNETNQKAIDALLKSLSKAPTKEKKFKDPNAPKRGKSSYLFFCSEHRENVKAQLGDGTKPTDVISELGVRWKALKETAESGKGSKKKQAESDFERYTNMAEKDKDRYIGEMEEYTPPSDEELVEMTEVKKKGCPRSPVGSPRTKDSNAPKRPKTAYLFFCAGVRESVKAKLDDPNAKNVMIELGVKWSELKAGTDQVSTKEFDKYTKMAEDDKHRYAEEMQHYTPPTGDDTGVVPKKKRSVKKVKSDDEEDDDEEADDDEEEDDEEEKPKPKPKPKKKQSGYIIFSKELRSKLINDNPNDTQAEITNKLQGLWKKMPDEEKEEWREKSDAESD